MGFWSSRVPPARWIVAAISVCVLTIGLRTSVQAAEREPITLTLKIENLDRTTTVYPPAKSEQGSTDPNAPRPLVFVFHGHGGSSQNVSRTFAIHDLWPEALVVYPQGLPTPSKLVDPEGTQSGWQHFVGEMDDRDLKFFDALLARLKTDYRVDDKRIYVTGHSNGGAFTFFLWSTRGDVFAAAAPSAAAMSIKLARPKPLPVIELAGQADPIVKYEWQEMTMNYIKRINGCEPEGKPAGEFCTEYPSPTGTPFVSYIHPGGHQFPKGASKRFVEFFQQHSKP